MSAMLKPDPLNHKEYVAVPSPCHRELKSTSCRECPASVRGPDGWDRVSRPTSLRGLGHGRTGNHSAFARADGFKVSVALLRSGFSSSSPAEAIPSA